MELHLLEIPNRSWRAQNIPAEGRDESGSSKPGRGVAGCCLEAWFLLPSSGIQPPEFERDHNFSHWDTRFSSIAQCDLAASTFDPDPHGIGIEATSRGHDPKLNLRCVANKETEKITATSARNGALLDVKLAMHSAGPPHNNWS